MMYRVLFLLLLFLSNLILKILKYRQLPLIVPGSIYGQRTNLMVLYPGRGGRGTRGWAYIREEKLQFAIC